MTSERADCAQTGRTTWVAAHDRDPHRIVKATGKHDTDQRGAAVAGDKRKRRGPLAVGEQPCPAECLERLGKEKEQPGRHEQARLAARERPRRGREMTDSQEREQEHEGSRPETESPARSPRVAKLPERSHQQRIAALEDDRSSRNGDSRHRMPIQLGHRWGERWGSPHGASFHEPSAACHLMPASTSAPRSISLEGYSKDDVKLSGKAARAPALAAGDREAKSAAVRTVV
jgi:hypothetical protein